jgi:hypothetical protein
MQVTVTAPSGFGSSEPVTALVYAWPNTSEAAAALDVNRDWSYTQFRQHHMAAFVDSVVKPCRASFEKAEGELEVVMTARSHRGTPYRLARPQPSVAMFVATMCSATLLLPQQCADHSSRLACLASLVAWSRRS